MFTESSAVTLWANGAADHLYDIEFPKGWKEVGKMVRRLQKQGLDMGHGEGIMGGKTYTIKDVERLVTLTRKIALKIDKKLGVKTDLGKW